MNGQANGHVRKREVEKNGIKNLSNHDSTTTENSAKNYPNLIEKDEKLKEWLRTRKLGFLSFIIPVSIVVILSTEYFGGSKIQNVLYSTWGWEPVEKTILYFSLWAIKEVSEINFNYLCTRMSTTF